MNCDSAQVCDPHVSSAHLTLAKRSPVLHSGTYSMCRLTERKMDRGKATYVGLPGRGVGSGSGKEDKGIFFFYNRINNIAPRFFSAQAASYKQE